MKRQTTDHLARRHRGALALAVPVLLGMISIAPPSLAGPATANPVTDMSGAATRLAEQQMSGLLADTLGRLTTREDAQDQIFVEGGSWQMPAAVRACRRCTFGPAVAASALYNLDHKQSSLLLARDWLDKGVAEQRADGSFATRIAKEGSSDIETMFFAAELGVALDLLATDLDDRRRATWTAALVRAADFLVTNKNLSWYTNGNIVIGNAAVMAAAWKATGDARYEALYNQALTFAISPPQARWPGFGLHLTRAPRLDDWSDGAGFFAEAGSRGVGYDGDYTQMQADLVARIFLLTGDERALRLLNILVNQLLVHTNDAWRLDISHGTRHWQAGQWRWFSNGALGVLAMSGRRSDLLPAFQGQIEAVMKNFSDPEQYAQPGTWYAVGMSPVNLVHAAEKFSTSTVRPVAAAVAKPKLNSATVRFGAIGSQMQITGSTTPGGRVDVYVKSRAESKYVRRQSIIATATGSFKVRYTVRDDHRLVTRTAGGESQVVLMLASPTIVGSTTHRQGRASVLHVSGRGVPGAPATLRLMNTFNAGRSSVVRTVTVKSNALGVWRHSAAAPKVNNVTVQRKVGGFSGPAAVARVLVKR